MAFKMKGMAFKSHVDETKEYESASSNEIVKVIDRIREIEKQMGMTAENKYTKTKPNEKLQKELDHLYHLRKTTHAD